MKSKYRIYKHRAEGVVQLHSIYGIQLWLITNTKVRKNHECQMCGRLVVQGLEKMYRPITNGINRMDRICRDCIENPK